MRALLDRLMAHLGYVPKRLMDEALAERLRFQVALHCKLVGSTTVCTLPCQLDERQRLDCHVEFLSHFERVNESGLSPVQHAIEKLDTAVASLALLAETGVH